MQSPSFKILKLVEQKDGSAILHFEVNDAFIGAYLRINKKKKATKRGVASWVLKLLKESFKHESDKS